MEDSFISVLLFSLLFKLNFMKIIFCVRKVVAHGHRGGAVNGAGCGFDTHSKLNI